MPLRFLIKQVILFVEYGALARMLCKYVATSERKISWTSTLSSFLVFDPLFAITGLLLNLGSRGLQTAIFNYGTKWTPPPDTQRGYKKNHMSGGIFFQEKITQKKPSRD